MIVFHLKFETSSLITKISSTTQALTEVPVMQFMSIKNRVSKLRRRMQLERLKHIKTTTLHVHHLFANFFAVPAQLRR